jgi:purine-binding chemotaxis protein CheW
MPEAVESSQNQEAANPERFLTFHLAKEEYGIDIMKVQELIGLVPITHVPSAPDYCRGVINLRGKIIPTIDLRSKLGMQPCDDTDRTCIVIVEVPGAVGQNHYGLVVDEVAGVLDIAQADLNPPPDYGSTLDETLIQAIGVVEGEVTILLDIDRVLSGDLLPVSETKI